MARAHEAQTRAKRNFVLGKGGKKWGKDKNSKRYEHTHTHTHDNIVLLCVPSLAWRARPPEGKGGGVCARPRYVIPEHERSDCARPRAAQALDSWPSARVFTTWPREGATVVLVFLNNVSLY